MDSLIALKGKDFVIIAADTTNAYSVLRMKVLFKSYRTMTIKFGTLMEKSFLLSVVNTQIFSSLATIFKKILLSWNTKMDTNCLPTILPNSFDQNWQKLSEKDLTVLTVCLQDFKVMNQDCTGLITLAL